jgi:bifunctional aspartokinase / homoserine dehydrogenase 1
MIILYNIMYVCKFGGTSLGDSNKIRNVITIVKDKLKSNDKLILIFSAIGRTTDDIINLGNMAKNNLDYNETVDLLFNKHKKIVNELMITDTNYIINKINFIFEEIKLLLLGISCLKDFNKKTSDKLLSYGEKLSFLIIGSFIKKDIDKNILMIDSSKYITTDSNFGNANVLIDKTNEKFKKIKTEDFDIIVTSGFISMNEMNDPTTLGRGGGDYTSAIFGSCFEVNKVEIWTDVDGIMTSDPKIVKNAEKIDSISYNEMMELSHYGANVIYTPTILPLYNKKIPIIVKNTFNPKMEGTIINFNKNERNEIATAISNIKNVSLVKVYGNYLIGKVGFSGNLFTLFSNNMINVIMISQSSSEHSIYIAIYESDSIKAKYNLEKTFYHQINNNEMIVQIQDNKSIIAIETNNCNNILDISAKIYPIFKKYNVPIYTQNTSDHNVSIALDRKHLISIQNLIHDEIFNHKKYINVLLVGVGLVGSELIEQIKNHDNIKVIGIANSKKILYDSNSIDINNYNIENGEPYTLYDIIDKFVDLKVFNKVFVDCTSSEIIYPQYLKLLDNNISVVTPNKKANTTNYKLFDKLRYYNNYRFETTVGAGLPIVDTIRNLINNGDRITKVEAILSGTMSYIFNTFSETDDSFLDVVLNAQKLGYTEPNPKDDLNGMDVMRKILIIARLSGLKLEMSDVHNNIFLSKECIESETTEDFFSNLKLYQNNINKLKEEASSRNKVIKHIATLQDGVASVGLQEIDTSSPFYYLNGSDNMLIITSNYYHTNKLIIRGPGAGASVTAAGVLSDILVSVD